MDKDDKKRLAYLEQRERARQDRNNTLIGYLVFGVIAAIFIFAYWNYQRTNGNTPDPSDANPYSQTCEQYGNC